MGRSRRHPPKAATGVIRAVLVKEETGSAFQPQEPEGGCYTLSYTVGAKPQEPEGGFYTLSYTVGAKPQEPEGGCYTLSYTVGATCEADFGTLCVLSCIWEGVAGAFSIAACLRYYFTIDHGGQEGGSLHVTRH